MDDPAPNSINDSAPLAAPAVSTPIATPLRVTSGFWSDARWPLWGVLALLAIDAGMFYLTRHHWSWNWGVPWEMNLERYEAALNNPALMDPLTTEPIRLRGERLSVMVLGSYGILTRALLVLVACLWVARSSPWRALGVHWQGMGARLRTTVKISAWSALALGALWCGLAAVLVRTGNEAHIRPPSPFATLFGFWRWVLMYVLIHPIIEEMLFRGLLHGALRRRVGVIAAVILNCAIFGGYHWLYGIPLASVPAYALLGLPLVLVYERTHSLWLVTAVHMAGNAVNAGVGLLEYHHPGVLRDFAVSVFG